MFEDYKKGIIQGREKDNIQQHKVQIEKGKTAFGNLNLDKDIRLTGHSQDMYDDDYSLAFVFRRVRSIVKRDQKSSPKGDDFSKDLLKININETEFSRLMGIDKLQRKYVKKRLGTLFGKQREDMLDLCSAVIIKYNPLKSKTEKKNDDDSLGEK